MTYIKDVFGRDLFRDFDRVIVGFDQHFNRLAQVHNEIKTSQANYPPVNIIRADNNRYIIELACAGFDQNELDIELDGDRLIITGKAANQPEQEFVYRGLAKRPFERSFLIDDKFVVKDASLQNGLLRIVLENVTNVSKKIKISINQPQQLQMQKQELLTE